MSSPLTLWRQMRPLARRAGHDVLEKAPWLYFALQSDATPAWARGVILSALAYLVNPADAVPDAVPVAGYGDDAAVLAGAVATVAVHITPEIKARAREVLDTWFG